MGGSSEARGNLVLVMYSLSGVGNVFILRYLFRPSRGSFCYHQII